ncbi:hypothetical protein BDV96DRAFT_653455 [Lophiotrema nucula]|uniref:Uncharacterized protein n=1 Tax=Lophiotrema nucula TaxID=690887 RepID=A0A6A5YN97_9PLEO|nr:hypothetical protein BDV96DRAFT_653455 [Lophiotrema nucula]
MSETAVIATPPPKANPRWNNCSVHWAKFEDWKTFDEVKVSAGEGCWHCSLYLACADVVTNILFPGSKVKDVSVHAFPDFAIRFTDPLNYKRLSIIGPDAKPSITQHDHDYVDHVPSLPWRAQYYKDKSGEADLYKLLPGSTSSDETIETIKRWIEECTQNHPGCSRVNSYSTPVRQQMDLHDF